MNTEAASGLDDWLNRLERLSPVEIVMGLERVATVLDRLALDRAGTVLHVAGTNGKGSSVAMLESLLRTTGRRVGSYTSPHVARYNERICVDGRPVADAPIVAAFERIEATRTDIPLTYFEFGTLAALAVFDALDVDIAILEVGMGGRLDAVNAVEADAALITNVSLDHCEWLGNDVEAIGREKAGIMRPARPVVFGAVEMPQSVAQHAADVGADLRIVNRDFSWGIGNPSSWH